jgi:hypothetical protein
MNNIENSEKAPRWTWKIPIIIIMIGIALIALGIFSKNIPSISTASISSTISSSLSSLSSSSETLWNKPEEKPRTVSDLCASIRNPKKIEVTLKPNNEWSEVIYLPNMAGKNFCFEGPDSTKIMDNNGKVYSIGSDLGFKITKFKFRGPAGEKVIVIYE